MSAPNGIAPQLPAHLGRSAPSRGPMAGWRNIGCRETPNGWPTDDKKTRHAAEIEALAEAGVAGSTSNLSIGICIWQAPRPLHHGSMPDYGLSYGGWQTDAPFERAQEVHLRCFSFRKAVRLADEREISKLPKDLAGNPERLTKMEEISEAS